jgi:hypothetical protein
MSERRTCFLHVGTHKTGTTSIQAALAELPRPTTRGDIHVPHAGRADIGGGHHNLAWELNGDDRFDPARGGLAAVLVEIMTRGCSRVVLSSEDFEYLHARPEALRRLTDGLKEIGYRPVIVIYLRPQASYLESLYAELVRHGLPVTFDAFFDHVIAAGRFEFKDRWRFAFDYDGFAQSFAAAFGHDNVIVRAYGTQTDVVGDFFRVVAGRTGAAGAALRRGRRLNVGNSFDAVLRQLERNTRGESSGGAEPQRRAGRFDPVHLAEVRRIVARFSAGNRRIEATYGIRIPCVSGTDLVGDIAAAIGIDRGSRARKRIVDEHARSLAPLLDGTRRPPRRARLVSAPRLARVALLEAIISVTAVVGFGGRIASTALVEFGMLSLVVALSAAVSLVRYGVESVGVVADRSAIDDWGVRATVLGYTLVGAYAIVNALLDVLLARYAPDGVSYPALVAIGTAALVVTAVQPLRQRLMRGNRRALVAGVSDARMYAGCCYVALVLQAAHALLSAWWLDTTIDLLVVAFVAFVASRVVRRSTATAAA